MEIKYKIDFVVILFSTIILIFLVGYSRPLVIAPIENFETTDNEILFSIEKASKLIIDDNIEFTTPEEYDVVDGLALELKPGKYYWKVVGLTSSEVRTLIIESEVNLKLVEDEEGYSVVNAGNVRLFVDVYDGEELMSEEELKVGEKIGILGNKLEAEMK
jgi:hypothetical protein